MPYVPFVCKLIRTLFDPKGQTSVTPNVIGGKITTAQDTNPEGVEH